MPYIDVIQHEEAEGELKEIYDHLVKTRGKLAEVHKIQSLNPPTIMHHMEFYLSVMFGKSPLKRVQREMIAVVVSKANDCDYCQQHHAEAVQHYWKDESKVNQLKDDYTQVDLSAVDLELCYLAWNMTKTPNWTEKESRIEKLKSLGLEDRAVLDAMLVISYFNFVNRMVLGLGVELSVEEVGGYNYE